MCEPGTDHEEIYSEIFRTLSKVDAELADVLDEKADQLCKYHRIVLITVAGIMGEAITQSQQGIGISMQLLGYDDRLEDLIKEKDQSVKEFEDSLNTLEKRIKRNFGL